MNWQHAGVFPEKHLIKVFIQHIRGGWTAFKYSAFRIRKSYSPLTFHTMYYVEVLTDNLTPIELWGIGCALTRGYYYGRSEQV